MSTWRAVVDLSGWLRAPATVRSITAGVLRGWGLEQLVADAEPVVSEVYVRCP